MPLKKIIAKGIDVRLFSSILSFSIIHVNIAETEYPIIYNDVYLENTHGTFFKYRRKDRTKG